MRLFENNEVMEKAKILAALANVGTQLVNPDEKLSEVLQNTTIYNPWFTQMECKRMLNSFSEKLLSKAALSDWSATFETAANPGKTVGLVLAGNVPFVGMHDILCVLASGHKAMVKLSSKDKFFFPWFKAALVAQDGYFEDAIHFVEQLKNFDAVIATGSNNAARYFEYYFGKHPHIIRKNRTSIAILTGNETKEEIYNLGKDIFYYYGLGCRNVGKVFIPENYDVQNLFKYWEDYSYVIDNNKYSNNYDYNRALLMLSNTDYLTNDFYMLVPNKELFSPLSLLYTETYNSDEDLQMKIDGIAENLQCIVAAAPGNTAFGATQFPGLSDYADHIDTMAFLQTI